VRGFKLEHSKPPERLEGVENAGGRANPVQHAGRDEMRRDMLG
jgi:hypothetical protein